MVTPIKMERDFRRTSIKGTGVMVDHARAG
jgi:hypothetical protein